MRVRVAGPAEEARMAEKADVIRVALMASTIPATGTSMSEWTNALVVVAGELIRQAPHGHVGVIVDEAQDLLRKVAMSEIEALTQMEAGT